MRWNYWISSESPIQRQRATAFPHEFSGGMRQRAMIAMAIANDPDLIIADEPTTALDVTIQAQILETLHKAQETTGAAIIMITHDLGVIAGAARPCGGDVCGKACGNRHRRRCFLPAPHAVHAWPAGLHSATRQSRSICL